MRYFVFILGCLFSLPIYSQATVATDDGDTTIYAMAEFMPMPLMKGCPYAEILDSARVCAEQKFMTLLAQNIRYPVAAVENNTQGMVVTQFVVEKDGRISHLKIIKDIGNGCGEEALRVLTAFEAAGARWLPAKQGDKLIRTRVTLPVRFKLEEALPYFINETGDTIYTQVSVSAAFKAGETALANHIFKNTKYPEDMAESCRNGVIEMSLIIYPNGKVKIDNLLDFNNLGGDFQFNAIQLANRTTHLWEPARYGDKMVATAFPIRVLFKSDHESCSLKNENFDKAMLLANEALALPEGQEHEAIEKMNQALQLHPENTELLYYRANLRIAQNKHEEACADFSTIKGILGITWFENFGRIICGW